MNVGTFFGYCENKNVLR